MPPRHCVRGFGRNSPTIWARTGRPARPAGRCASMMPNSVPSAVGDDDVAERRTGGERREILADHVADIAAEAELEFERRNAAGDKRRDFTERSFGGNLDRRHGKRRDLVFDRPVGGFEDGHPRRFECDAFGADDELRHLARGEQPDQHRNDGDGGIGEPHLDFACRQRPSGPRSPMSKSSAKKVAVIATPVGSENMDDLLCRSANGLDSARAPDNGSAPRVRMPGILGPPSQVPLDRDGGDGREYTRRGPARASTVPDLCYEIAAFRIARRSPSMSRFLSRIVLCAVLAFGIAALAQVASAGSAAAQGAVSVAVLPFANVSGDAGQDALADGLTEELAAVLANVPGLDIGARASAFRFKASAAGLSRHRRGAQEDASRRSDGAQDRRSRAALGAAGARGGRHGALVRGLLRAVCRHLRYRGRDRQGGCGRHFRSACRPMRFWCAAARRTWRPTSSMCARVR